MALSQCQKNANAEFQKDFIRPVSGFSTKNARIMYLLNLAKIWRMKFNKCYFSSQFSSLGVKLCHISNVVQPLYAKYANISNNTLKMSRFPSRNVRYPRYQDTNFLQVYLMSMYAHLIDNSSFISSQYSSYELSSCSCFMREAVNFALSDCL